MRLYFVLAALICTLTLSGVSSSAAQADVPQHNQTGEQPTSQPTESGINEEDPVRLEGGGVKTVNPAGTVVKAEKPDEADDLAGRCAFVIPISGPLDQIALIEGVEKALDEAKKRKAAVVVFVMNTPGGRVYIADRIIKKIEKVDWATTVAFIRGPDKEALSAGAYICLSCETIFMAPGTIIGAATPYSKNESGQNDIDKKFQSAFQARFRSLAQTRGHSAVVADAMVGSDASGITQVFIDEKPQIVTNEEADRLEKGRPDQFRRGKVIHPPGRILTLTSSEALEFGIISGVVETEAELLQKMDRPNLPVIVAKWLPQWVDQTSKARTKTIDDLRSGFALGADSVKANIDMCVAADDKNKAKRFLQKAIDELKKTAVVVNKLEQLSKDERYDLYINQEDLNALKTDMEALYSRLRMVQEELK